LAPPPNSAAERARWVKYGLPESGLHLESADAICRVCRVGLLRPRVVRYEPRSDGDVLRLPYHQGPECPQPKKSQWADRTRLRQRLCSPGKMHGEERG